MKKYPGAKSKDLKAFCQKRYFATSKTTFLESRIDKAVEDGLENVIGIGANKKKTKRSNIPEFKRNDREKYVLIGDAFRELESEDHLDQKRELLFVKSQEQRKQRRYRGIYSKSRKN